MRIAVGLVHYPILDQRKNVVATNITNLDIHDIARASRVFGVERYTIIHPQQDQQSFVSRVLEHWRVGDGAKFNPMRRTSLTMVHTASSIEEAVRDWGGDPYIVSTHARELPGIPAITFRGLREKIEKGPADEQLFLIFGTGCGLTEDVMRGCDFLLEPIRGAPPDDYRHLSVRSAVSICLDRLLGAW